ncbi:MAG: hypothetical protein ACRCSQ_05655 [Bacteroidales bacterium]
MKQFLQIISVFLLGVILVETTGLSRIQHCCGSSEILLALSEIELFCTEKSCEDVYQEHHQCHQYSSSITSDEVENEHVHGGCCDHSESVDICDSHTAPGFHTHHHSDQCVDADFLQLRPEQKQDNYFLSLSALMPVEILLFDFKPQPVVLPMADKYIFTIPDEAGRYKLALYSVFLI